MQREEVAAELEHHRPAILAYLSRVLGQDTSEREDIAQETYLREYRAIARGQAIQSQTLRPWLYRIARNVAIDLWRHRTYLTLVPLDEMESPQQDSTEDRVIERTEDHPRPGAVTACLCGVSAVLSWVWLLGARDCSASAGGWASGQRAADAGTASMCGALSEPGIGEPWTGERVAEQDIRWEAPSLAPAGLNLQNA